MLVAVNFVLPTKLSTRRCGPSNIGFKHCRIAHGLSTIPSDGTLHVITPCHRTMSDVVSPMLNRDRMTVDPSHPRDPLSGFMTSILLRDSTEVKGGTSVKLYGVNKLHDAVPGNGIACNSMLRVTPFRGRLYVISLANDQLARLVRRVTTIKKRNVDNTQLIVARRKRLLGTRIGNQPVSPRTVCAVTALSCLTRKGSGVCTLGGRLAGGASGVTMHSLVVRTVQETSTRKHGMATRVRKQVMGRWGVVGGALMGYLLVTFLSKRTYFATATRNGRGIRLHVVRAGSARDYVVPIGPGSTSATVTSGKKFMHQATLLHNLQGRSTNLLLFSYKSFSRNSTCCGVCGKRIRVGLVGRVHCSTTAVKGRRFSFKLSGVTQVLHVTSFPFIYTGCRFRNAPMSNLIGPCIVVRQGKLEVKIFKLKAGLRNVITRKGHGKIACRSPIATTGHATSLLGGQRRYSLIIYLSRLN